MRFLLLLVFLTYPVLAQQPVRGWFDIAPKEYPEFAPRYIKVPKEDNGLTQLYEAAESIMEIPGVKDEHFTKKYSKKNAEKWLKLVEKNQAVFDKLTSAVNAKYLQPKKATGFDESYVDIMSSIGAAKNLAWLAKLHLANQDKEQYHFHTKIHHVLTQKLFETDSSLVAFLVALASYNGHLQELYHAVQNETFDQEDLNKISTLFMDELSIRNSAKRSLNYEFTIAADTIYQLYAGTMMWDADAPAKNLIKKNVSLFLMRIVYQPNKTIRILADHTSLVQQMIDTPFPQRKKLNEKYEIKVLNKLERRRSIFAFNQIGRSLLHLCLSPIKNSADKIDEIALNAAFVRTIIALKSYHLKYNELPESLESLTPKFIAELPTDPYSGKTLRYNKDLKILWSVGANLENENGHDPKLLDKLNPFAGLDDQSDPTVLIPF